MAHDNKSLGKFVLDGIPGAPRGVPQIEVSFDINADGILNVTASDKSTGREQAMQIVPSSGLSDEEIDQMVTDAEKFASEDEARRKGVETRNMAETAAHGAEKFAEENKEKLTEAQVTALTELATTVRAALSSDNEEAITKAVEDLNAALQEIGTAMYQQEAAAGGADAGAAEGDAADDDEDVIEGEFTEE